MILAFLISLVAAASAGVTHHTVSLARHHAHAQAPTGPDHEQAWFEQITLPAHDTALGQLNRVTVRVVQSSQVQYFYENLSFGGGYGQPVRFGRPHASLTLGDPQIPGKILAASRIAYPDEFFYSGQGDGLLDWGGTGGHTSPRYIRHCVGETVSRTAAGYDLSLFASPVAVDVVGRSQFLLSSGDGYYAFGLQHWSAGRVELTYYWG